MTKRNILLVEDDLTLGDLFVYAFTRRGHEVTWYVRARLDQANKLVFMNVRGEETIFDTSPAAALPFDYAFVDYRLKGSALQGVDVTRALSRQGLKVIATSGMRQLNQQLIEAGAVSGIEKFDLISGELP